MSSVICFTNKLYESCIMYDVLIVSLNSLARIRELRIGKIEGGWFRTSLCAQPNAQIFTLFALLTCAVLCICVQQSVSYNYTNYPCRYLIVFQLLTSCSANLKIEYLVSHPSHSHTSRNASESKL